MTNNRSPIWREMLYFTLVTRFFRRYRSSIIVFGDYTTLKKSVCSALYTPIFSPIQIQIYAHNPVRDAFPGIVTVEVVLLLTVHLCNIKVEILEGQSLGYSRNSSSTSKAAKPIGTFAIAIDLQFPRFSLFHGGRGDFSYLVQRYKIYITLQIN